jgi:hypothetical protein
MGEGAAPATVVNLAELRDTKHNLGVLDVSSEQCSCFVLALPAAAERDTGFSPVIRFKSATLTQTPQQNQESAMWWASRFVIFLTHASRAVAGTPDERRIAAQEVGIALKLGCVSSCTDSMVHDACFAMACMVDLAEVNGPIPKYQSVERTRLAEELSVAARLRHRLLRWTRAASVLAAGDVLPFELWGGTPSDCFMAAIVLGRHVGVADSPARGKVGQVRVTRHLPPVSDALTLELRRGVQATVSTPLPQNSIVSGLDCLRVVVLLHVDGVHYQRLLPLVDDPDYDDYEKFDGPVRWELENAQPTSSSWW